MDKDFIYDYALKLFIESSSCPEIFLVVDQSPTKCQDACKEVLIRQLLHCLMWSLIKSKDKDVRNIRIIFENVPNLVRSITALNNDDELRIVVDDYFEEIVDFFQILALKQLSSSTLRKQLEELTGKTIKFVDAFRQKLKPPVIQQVHEYHQTKLKERLARFCDEESVSIEGNSLSTSENSNVPPSDITMDKGMGMFGCEANFASPSDNQCGYVTDSSDVSLRIVDSDSSDEDVETEVQSEKYEAEVQIPDVTLPRISSPFNAHNRTTDVVKGPNDVAEGHNTAERNNTVVVVLIGQDEDIGQPSSDENQGLNDVDRPHKDVEVRRRHVDRHDVAVRQSDVDECRNDVGDQLNNVDVSPTRDVEQSKNLVGNNDGKRISDNDETAPKVADETSEGSCNVLSSSLKASNTMHAAKSPTQSLTPADWERMWEKQIKSSQETQNTSPEPTDSESMEEVEVALNQTKTTQRRPFAPETDAMLIHGVQTYGVGCWKIILDNYKFPSYRSSVHLKDRWRTLTNKGVVKCSGGRLRVLGKEQAREFKKLSEAVAERKKRSTPTIRLRDARSKETNAGSPGKSHHDKTSRCGKRSPIPVISSSGSDTDVEEIQSEYFAKKSLSPQKQVLRKGSTQPVVRLTDLRLDKNLLDSLCLRLGSTDEPPPKCTNSTVVVSSHHSDLEDVTKDNDVTTKQPDQDEPGHNVEVEEQHDDDIEASSHNKQAAHPTDDCVKPDGNDATDHVQVRQPQSDDEPAQSEPKQTNDRCKPDGNNATDHVQVRQPQSDDEPAPSEPKQKKRRRLWDAEGETLTWDNDPLLVPNFGSSSKSLFAPPSRTSEKKRRKKPWSEAEVSNLIAGLRRYGAGQWAMILDKYTFSNRNSVMLKDKYRNMVKNYELPRDLRPSSTR